MNNTFDRDFIKGLVKEAVLKKLAGYMLSSVILDIKK